MYLGALSNGPNGGNRRPTLGERRAQAFLSRCAVNPQASDWTGAKYGVPTRNGRPLRKPPGVFMNPAQMANLPTPKAYRDYMTRLGYGHLASGIEYWYECQAGWPEYEAFKFAEMAKRFIPTAEETAEAFVEEVKKVAPPLVEKPILVPAPPGVPAPAPPVLKPPPVRAPDMRYIQPYVPPPNGTLPVDSAPPEFPLMARFRAQQAAKAPSPAADATPEAMPTPDQVKAAQQRGAGIGTILALGIPIALAIAGG